MVVGYSMLLKANAVSSILVRARKTVNSFKYKNTYAWLQF